MHLTTKETEKERFGGFPRPKKHKKATTTNDTKIATIDFFMFFEFAAFPHHKKKEV